MTTQTEQRTAPISRREQNARAVQLLEQYCDRLQPGDRLPTHTDLMHKLGTSERMTLSAINTLKKQGRLTRRYGSGTFVAQLPEGNALTTAAPQNSKQNTIALFMFRDHSFSAYGSDLLLRIAETKDLSIALRTVPNHLIDTHTVHEYIPPTMPTDLLGCVVIGGWLLPLAKRLVDEGLPVVALANFSPDPQFHSIPCIRDDNAYGGYLAAKYLIDLGHRRICYGTVNTSYAEMKRWEGHCEAMDEARKAGISIEAKVLLNDEFDHWLHHPKDAIDYFNSPERPTAFCAWNDQVALIMMNFFMRIGIKTPEDVSIIGYDNLPELTLLNIPITTIDPHLETQVRYALRRLVNAANGIESENAIIIPTLVPRASTSPYQKETL